MAKILRNGEIYTYGRDKKGRPIVVIDFPKMDFANNEIEDYYSAINAVLSVVINHCFVKGVI